MKGGAHGDVLAEPRRVEHSRPRQPCRSGRRRVAAGAVAGALLTPAAVVLLWALGLGGGSVLLVVVVWALVLPTGTPGARLVLAAVVLSAVASTWLLVTSALHVGLAAPVLLGVVAVVGGSRLGALSRPRVSAQAGASGAGVLGVGVAVIWISRTESAAAALARLVHGEDNASHLSIMMGIRESGAYLYAGRGPLVGRVFTGLQNYPQGLHAVSAIVSQLAHPGPLDVAAAVLHYRLAILLAGALAAVAVSESALALATRLGADGRSLYVASLLPLIIMVLGPPLDLFRVGFFSQLGGYVALGAMVVTALLPAERVPPWSRLALLSAGLVFTAASWYFLLPVALVLACAACWPMRAFLRATPGRAAVLAVATAAGMAPHVVNSLAAGAVGALNAPGGVLPLNPVLLGLALGVPLVPILILRDQWRSTVGWWLPWTAAGMFSLLIGAYQLATKGQTSYYYQKSLYTILLLSIVGIAGTAASLLSTNIRTGVAPRSRAALAAALALALVFPAVLQRGCLLTPKWTPARRDLGWGEVLRLLPQRRTAPVIVWQAGDLTSDYQANRLLGAVYGQDGPVRWLAVQRSLHGQNVEVFGPLLHDRGTVILTTTADLPRRLIDNGVPAQVLTSARIMELKR